MSVDAGQLAVSPFDLALCVAFGEDADHARLPSSISLIVAASQATIVLEARWRSGSLNTAGHTSDLGRPLGAVPGPVTSSASAGCHRLIREFQAVLVTTADEMAELAPRADRLESVGAVPAESLSISASEHPTTVRLIDAMSDRAPRSPSELAARSGLSVAEVQGCLAALEVDGVVVERERGWVKVRAKR